MKDMIAMTIEGSAVVLGQAAFSPDGNTLGSMNLSGIPHLWRAPSWAEIEAAEADKKRGL